MPYRAWRTCLHARGTGRNAALAIVYTLEKKRKACSSTGEAFRIAMAHYVIRALSQNHSLDCSEISQLEKPVKELPVAADAVQTGVNSPWPEPTLSARPACAAACNSFVSEGFYAIYEEEVTKNSQGFLCYP